MRAVVLDEIKPIALGCVDPGQLFVFVEMADGDVWTRTSRQDLRVAAMPSKLPCVTVTRLGASVHKPGEVVMWDDDDLVYLLKITKPAEFVRTSIPGENR